MSPDSRSSKHYKSCWFEIKSTQPGSQIYVTINHYLLAIIMFKQSSYQFEKCLQNVIAMHDGKGLYTSCAGKHGGQYKTNFISLKPVLAFQTLTLATLGNWATTHQRVFFLDISWQSSNAAHPFFVWCISFDAWSIHVFCSPHSNQCKQSVPRFPLYICCEIWFWPHTL